MDTITYNRAISLSDEFWTEIYPRHQVFMSIIEHGEDGVEEHIHVAVKALITIAIETFLVYDSYQKRIESMDIPEDIFPDLSNFINLPIQSDNYESYGEQLKGIRDKIWGYCVKNVVVIKGLMDKSISYFREYGELKKADFTQNEIYLLYICTIIAFMESVFRQKELRLMEGEYGS